MTTLRKDRKKNYKSQCARDAQQRSYGNKTYWDYLEKTTLEAALYYKARGDHTKAKLMLTQSLDEALQGNDGD